MRFARSDWPGRNRATTNHYGTAMRFGLDADREGKVRGRNHEDDLSP